MPEPLLGNRNQRLDKNIRVAALGLALIIFLILGLTFPDTPIGLLLGMLLPALLGAFAFVFGLAFVLTIIGKYKTKAIH